MTAAAAMDWFNSRPERPGHEVMADVFRTTADKIERDPSLLAIPLANIDRWLANGHSATRRLEEWRSLVADAVTSRKGMAKLLEILRDQSADAVFFKEFSPFPGVLSSDELDQFKWTSFH